MNSRFLILLYVLISSGALVALRFGASGAPLIFLGLGRHRIEISAISLLGVAMYFISFPIYAFLISRYELGFIIPIATGCIYIVVFSASFFLFNETFNLIKISGIGLILLGVSLLSIAKS